MTGRQHDLGVQHLDGLPEDILARLEKSKIYLSKRGDSLRISPYLYNSEGDAESLVNALKLIMQN